MRHNNHRPATSRMTECLLKNTQARLWRFAVIATFALTLAGVVMPVQAATLTGAFGGDSTLTSTGTPGVFIQDFSGDGSDMILGSFTASSHSTIDFSNPPGILISNGMLTETFSNGTLEGTTSGDGTASGHGTATFTIDFLITGGTGVFAGDTGEATLKGTITQTGPTTESITGSYTALLTAVPEPSTLALLTAGLIACCLSRRRQV